MLFDDENEKAGNGEGEWKTWTKRKGGEENVNGVKGEKKKEKTRCSEKKGIS